MRKNPVVTLWPEDKKGRRIWENTADRLGRKQTCAPGRMQKSRSWIEMERSKENCGTFVCQERNLVKNVKLNKWLIGYKIGATWLFHEIYSLPFVALNPRPVLGCALCVWVCVCLCARVRACVNVCMPTTASGCHSIWVDDITNCCSICHISRSLRHANLACLS